MRGFAMRTRLLLALLLALTVLVNMITPTTAHAQSIEGDDATTRTSDENDNQLTTDNNETAGTTTLTQLTSYTDIGLALFSAQSQAEINQLSTMFDAARAKQPTARNQSRNMLIGMQLTRAITGETDYKKKLPSNALSSIVRKGDVLLRRTGIHGCTLWNVVPLCKYWARVYEHAGIYYGKDTHGIYQVYESTNVGGVQFKPVGTWQLRDSISAFIVHAPSHRPHSADPLMRWYNAMATLLPHTTTTFSTKPLIERCTVHNSHGNTSCRWVSTSIVTALSMHNGSLVSTVARSAVMSGITPSPPTRSVSQVL
jgi:hypothetical protein